MKANVIPINTTINQLSDFSSQLHFFPFNFRTYEFHYLQDLLASITSNAIVSQRLQFLSVTLKEKLNKGQTLVSNNSIQQLCFKWVGVCPVGLRKSVIITNSWAPSNRGMGLAGSIHVDTNGLIAVIPKKTRRSDSDSAAPDHSQERPIIDRMQWLIRQTSYRRTSLCRSIRPRSPLSQSTATGWWRNR